MSCGRRQVGRRLSAPWYPPWPRASGVQFGFRRCRPVPLKPFERTVRFVGMDVFAPGCVLAAAREPNALPLRTRRGADWAATHADQHDFAPVTVPESRAGRPDNLELLSAAQH